MCGICGFSSSDADHIVPAQLLERMNLTMSHRGPDSTGLAMFDTAGLAMTRLSIIDLAGGDQPMWNEDRSLCIVFNGELYNFRDLQPELAAKGHHFSTKCDTEVVLHAYEEWGPECLQHFNGMFALAIWNDRDKTLFLARDRLGEKPLYYYRDADRLIFASEIKAVLQDPSVPRQVNPRGLANFLTFGHAVPPETMFEGIYKLLPGHYALVSGNDLKINKYWDVGEGSPEDGQNQLSADQYAEQILDLLDDSVRRRMIADVPLGAFLSGGLDSSSVVALMKRHASGPVKTFSLGFSIGGAYNELSEAAQVANHLQTEHHELNVEHTDLVGTLRTLVYHYDEPFGDPAGFPVYLLSCFARQHVKVALTGDGGDELFGGYRRYTADQFATLYQRLPDRLIRNGVPELVSRLPRLRRTKKIAHTLQVGDPGHRYAGWLTVFDPEMRAEVLDRDIIDELGHYDPAWQYPQYYSSLDGSSRGDHLNRLMYVDVKTLLVDEYLEKTDKASMACGLEARLPLLDHRLVELAFQIPGHLKIRGISTKRILKKAVQDIVPPEVLRRRKHGFSVPTDPWFRGDLKSFAFDVLFDERSRRRGYFNMGVLERFWQEHLQGRHVRDSQLWLLLNFELWHRIYLDREPV